MKVDDPKAGMDVGKIVNHMAGAVNCVSHLLLFVLTSAHGIESLDLTNCIRILFHLWRYFTPSYWRDRLSIASFRNGVSRSRRVCWLQGMSKWGC